MNSIPSSSATDSSTTDPNPHSTTVARIVGWDVGGAHLKAAVLDHEGRVAQVVQLPCPLWLGMDHLRTACDTLLAALPAGPLEHAVTMTGEMADLFSDRRHGVTAIVDSLVEQLVQGRGEPVRIFAGTEGFVATDDAPRLFDRIASANWFATAQWCARSIGRGILVDIGSTTTDLIPFDGGRVCALGASDGGRLDHGELAYVGIVRTPLMGMGERAPFGGRWRATIKEYYATTADVFRILGELDEACDVQPAADNGPKTREASARRMLRGVGEDLDAVTPGAIDALAGWYRERLLHEIVEALALRISHGDVARDAALIGAGIGRHLVAEVARRLQRPAQSIDDLLCAPDAAVAQCAALRGWAAHCAPAAAVALLAYATR